MLPAYLNIALRVQARSYPYGPGQIDDDHLVGQDVQMPLCDGVTPGVWSKKARRRTEGFLVGMLLDGARIVFQDSRPLPARGMPLRLFADVASNDAMGCSGIPAAIKLSPASIN